MNLYNSIEETKDNNNKKFNDMKENVIIVYKFLDINHTKAARRRLSETRNRP